MSTAVYLLNRSSSKSIGGKTPYQLWMGSVSGVQHLHTFGCIAHMKLTTLNPKELDDRSQRTIFVGYDVVFDEGAHWRWTGEVSADTDDFVVEEGHTRLPQAVTVSTSITPATPTPASASTSSPVPPSPTAP